MSVRMPPIVLTVLALVLIPGLAAQAQTADAALCAAGGSPAAEPAFGTPDAQPAQTCGPCLLQFCAQPGIRCNFTGCGLNNCCAYSCVCDLSCTSGGTPGNTCRFLLPDNCLCGNMQIDSGEECDGTNLGGASCVSLGFDGGTLACSGICTYDKSGCQKCNNGVREGSEQCDMSDLGGASCVSLGFDGGTLACNGSCGFDTSGCHKCGNGVCEDPEDCNSCSSDCDSKTNGPPGGRFCCGNGIPESAEGIGCSVCDGNC